MTRRAIRIPADGTPNQVLGLIQMPGPVGGHSQTVQGLTIIRNHGQHLLVGTHRTVKIATRFQAAFVKHPVCLPIRVSHDCLAPS